MSGIYGTPEAKNAVLHQGELSLTLTAHEGEPLELRDVARAMSGLDGVLRAIATEIAPAEHLVPVLLAMDLMDEKCRITVRIQPARPRRKRTVAK